VPYSNVLQKGAPFSTQMSSNSSELVSVECSNAIKMNASQTTQLSNGSIFGQRSFQQTAASPSTVVSIAQGVELRLPNLTRPQAQIEPSTAAAAAAVTSNWPPLFEFPVSNISPILKQILQDASIELRPNEVKEIIEVLFQKMLPLTGLYPKSQMYLLGVDSIFRQWRHLLIINGKCGRKIFGTKIKLRFHQHRALDVEAANSPLVVAARARHTPPTRRRRLEAAAKTDQL